MAKKRGAPKKPTKTKPALKKVAKPIVRKKAGAKRSTAKARPISLGRPKVTAEEKLYMLFHDDYQARQLFEFLRVESVGELERHSPAEIVDRLSQPVKNTVERIRRILADKNRCLRGDQEFAAKHKT